MAPRLFPVPDCLVAKRNVSIIIPIIILFVIFDFHSHQNTLSFTYRMWKMINKNLIDIYRLLWYDSWYTFWYFVLFYKFARLSDILKDYLEWKFVKFYLKVLWFSGRMTSGIIRWKRNSKFWRFSKEKRKNKSKIKRTKYGYKKKIVRIRIEMFHVA